MAVQSVDPNIFLGADQRTRAANPFKGVAERLQKLELGEESLKTSRKARQDQAEAEEFLKLQPLIATNPEAALAQLSQSTVFDDADRDALATAISVGDQGTIDTFTQISNKRLGVTPKPGFTLGEDQVRFDAQGNEIARGPAAATDAIPSLPPILLEGLSQELGGKAEAAFRAAGGGKDGMKAFTSVVDKGTEQERRLTSPKLIRQSFPQASQAENRQLQAAMDSAKTTEAGLKAAGKVRSEQRRLKKAKSFQNDAVTLLQGIIQHPELNDVLGSIEGAIDFRLQDSEAQLIADIDQATNILTADNMDLMTGVLSESDIAILKSISGGGLNRKRTPARFKGDVQKIIDKLSAVPVTTADDAAGFDLNAAQARLADLKAKAGIQ